jgi:tetratricopeptide (TPR) repeat protein
MTDPGLPGREGGRTVLIDVLDAIAGRNWPVRCGDVPPRADGFSARPETAPPVAFTPAADAVILPARAPGAGAWLTSTGKTQLAAEFAESEFRSGRLDALVWVSASSRMSVLSGYAEAAAAILGSASDTGGDLAATHLLRWLAETPRPWLVVLDGVRDPADLDQLWPAGPAGMTLLTATEPAVVPADRPVLSFPVGPLSGREAMAFLRGRLAADTDLRGGMIDLVTELAGEPIALAQASGAIAASGLTCTEYLAQFVQRRGQAEAAARASLPGASIAWTFAAEQADRMSGGGAWSMLTLASMLDGRGFPAAVFETTAAGQYLGAPSRPAIDETLTVLEEMGLLARDRQGAGVWISSVVQAAIRASMTGELLAQAVTAATDALLEMWPSEPTPWSARSLRACAVSVARTAGDQLWDGACPPLLLRVGQSLSAVGLFRSACAHWNEVTATADRLLGRDHPDTLSAAGKLAEAYLTAGDAARSVDVFDWILGQLAARLGPDHPDVLSARLDVGRALTAAGRLDDAITVLGSAVSASELVLGADHPNTIRAREQLASTYHAAAHHREAIDLLRRALADRERLQGARSPDTISARKSLAAAHLAAGNVKEAVLYSKRVVADLERAVGPDHPETITAKGNLGSAYHAAGKMAAAVRLHEEARQGSEGVLGPDHPQTLARCASLASAYYAVGRIGDAAALYRDTLQRCQRVLPLGDPVTSAVREGLASVAGS